MHLKRDTCLEPPTSPHVPSEKSAKQQGLHLPPTSAMGFCVFLRFEARLPLLKWEAKVRVQLLDTPKSKGWDPRTDQPWVVNTCYTGGIDVTNPPLNSESPKNRSGKRATQGGALLTAKQPKFVLPCNSRSAQMVLFSPNAPKWVAVWDKVSVSFSPSASCNLSTGVWDELRVSFSPSASWDSSAPSCAGVWDEMRNNPSVGFAWEH